MRIILSLLAACTLLFTSCNKYKKTPSGMTYKINAVSKEKAKVGNVMKYNLLLKLDGKDTVLENTAESMPGYIMVDTANLPKHFFTEVLTELGEGDKMDFVMNIDTLIKLKMLPGYDQLFKKGGKINGKLEVVKVYPNKDAVKGDYEKDLAIAKEKRKLKMEKETAGERAKEEQNIQQYLAANKITNAVKTPEGVYVVMEKEGAGPKADSGKQVMVMYKGYTLDGKVFDKNVDADAQHKDPIGVVLGANGVIPGWELGLKSFSKGSKGKIIIPFLYGYGSQGAPPTIAPFSTLVFDIEVVDIKNPPAQAAAPSVK